MNDLTNLWNKASRLLLGTAVMMLMTLPAPAAPASGLLDRINFGDAASEGAHGFDPGVVPGDLPPGGVGTLGQTFRQVSGPVAAGGQNRRFTFTLACDPARQNYATVKLWGNDRQRGILHLLLAPDGKMSDDNMVDINNQGEGQRPAFAGRFYYVTLPILLTATQGKTTVTLVLDAIQSHDGYFGTGDASLKPGYSTRPIYSAFSHADPFFEPPPGDPTGMAPPRLVTPLKTFRREDADALLLGTRHKMFGPGGRLEQMLARQILPTTPGAPRETWGLDAGRPAAEMARDNPSADEWRKQASRKQGAGYTTFSDDLLSTLYVAYLTPPLRDLSGRIVPGLDRFHDVDLLRRIVLLLDSATYLPREDGGFATGDSDEWPGLTSAPRVGGRHPGMTKRFDEWGLSLEGVNTQSLGITIERLLNDLVAAPKFRAVLEQPMDSDLRGTMLRRADVYSQMLFKHLHYCRRVTGGTPAQNQFMMTGLIWDQAGLEKLRQFYPNPSFPPLPRSVALYYVEQALGIAPTTLLRQTEKDNFDQSDRGLAQEGGGTYDGGYGTSNPWLVPFMAQAVAVLPSLQGGEEKRRVDRILAMARATVSAYDYFISPGDDAVDPDVTQTKMILSAEDYITMRNVNNPNSRGFSVNSQYLASDPDLPIQEPFALRSAYLETQYGHSPGGQGLFQRQFASYENTLRAIAGKGPGDLPALPGEPGQPDFVYADPKGSALALIHGPERLYLNMNWRRERRGVNYVARYHFTTPTVDRVGMAIMPHDAATMQSDGNLSGDFDQPWIVRYGPYLIVFNRSKNACAVKLPLGQGQAEDLLTRAFHPFGGTLEVPSGQAAVLYLSAPSGVPSSASGAAASTPDLPVQAANTVLRGSSTELRVPVPAQKGVVYAWKTLLKPSLSPPPIFASNHSGAARVTRVTFFKSGSYQLEVIAKDAGGRRRTGMIIVQVPQVPTRLDAGPKAVTLTDEELDVQGGARRRSGFRPMMNFSAVVLDQFDDPLQVVPDVRWSLQVGSVGSLTTVGPNGRYQTEPQQTGQAHITAAYGKLTDTCTVSVVKPAPGVGSTGLLFEKQ